MLANTRHRHTQPHTYTKHFFMPIEAHRGGAIWSLSKRPVLGSSAEGSTPEHLQSPQFIHNGCLLKSDRNSLLYLTSQVGKGFYCLKCLAFESDCCLISGCFRCKLCQGHPASAVPPSCSLQQGSSCLQTGHSGCRWSLRSCPCMKGTFPISGVFNMQVPSSHLHGLQFWIFFTASSTYSLVTLGMSVSEWSSRSPNTFSST